MISSESGQRPVSLADTSILPWQIAEAGKPVKIVRNRRWRQFTKIVWRPGDEALTRLWQFFPRPYGAGGVWTVDTTTLFWASR